MITLNGHDIIPTLFPDHTSQVWKLPSGAIHPGTNLVRWTFTHEGEFMHLAQLKGLIDKTSNGESILVLSYLPYGRQDKPVSDGATFGLTTFALLLNTLWFDEVTISDPHSAEALRLINNSAAYYPAERVRELVRMTGARRVCYPDHGAALKYGPIYGFDDSMVVVAEKIRDQSTGRITYIKIVSGECRGDSVLIVDDICDGGATFCAVAQALYAAGAFSVDLFVSHGIFSKGLAKMRENGISSFYTIQGRAHEAHDHTIQYTPYRSL